MSQRHPVFVVGFDGSVASSAALVHAARLTGAGRLVVVHAHEPAPKQLDERWREILSADQEARSQAVLRELPAEIAAALDDIAWETMSVDGPTARALCAVADDVDADAIVVGTHGAGLIDALLGSVARTLIQQATRPIVVIPPPAVERFEASRR